MCFVVEEEENAKAEKKAPEDASEVLLYAIFFFPQLLCDSKVYAKNVFAAGALSHTPLGSKGADKSQCSSRSFSWPHSSCICLVMEKSWKIFSLKKRVATMSNDRDQICRWSQRFWQLVLVACI